MILKQILKAKTEEVALLKRSEPFVSLLAKIRVLPRPRGFVAALRKKRPLAVIAEIKRRSPSRGVIRRDFRPAWIASRYAHGGAAALSVLTDQQFFGGCADDLRRARRSSGLPVLRKDFIIDEYQIYESRAMGADAILLIAAALPVTTLARFYKLAQKLGLDVLVEIHTAAEWGKVRALKPRLVGINNRNLRSFEVRLKTFERLARRVPKHCVLVAESGLHTPEDISRMRRAGARAVLVGEGLIKHSDPGRALKDLLR